MISLGLGLGCLNEMRNGCPWHGCPFETLQNDVDVNEILNEIEEWMSMSRHPLDDFTSRPFKILGTSPLLGQQ